MQLAPAVVVELEEQRVRLAGARDDLRRVAGVRQLRRARTSSARWIASQFVEDAVEQRRAGAAELGKERVDEDELPVDRAT